MWQLGPHGRGHEMCGHTAQAKAKGEGRTTMRALAYAAVAAVAAAVLVFGTPAALSTSLGPKGSLAVNIAEIPGGTPANVVILGPNNYQADVTDTSVLEDLRPGTYVAYATAGDSTWGTWLARPASSEVVVGSGQHASMTFAFTLKPSNEPNSGRGDPNAFAFVAGSVDDPVRWNPCRTITWVPEVPVPPGEQQRLEAAFNEVSRATGIPFAQVASGQDADIDVNISLVAGSRVDGEGSMEYIPPYANIKGRAISGRVDGTIGVDTPPELRTALYLHEIGHVIGLAHTADSSQVMYEVVEVDDAYGFGAGDLNGLRRLGTEAGCLNPPPAPQNLEVAEKDQVLELTWFQPSAEPPVTETRVRIVDATGRSAAETSLPWVTEIPGPSGELSGKLRVPASACDPARRLQLVISNAYGDTATPFVVPSCANA